MKKKSLENQPTLIYYNIRYLCSKRGIKMKNLENEIGVSKGYICRIKSEQRDISVSVATSIADILDVSLHDLLTTNIAKSL